ncbi:hypothetical protein [Candidatus Harpocratesius sp.]
MEITQPDNHLAVIGEKLPTKTENSENILTGVVSQKFQDLASKNKQCFKKSSIISQKAADLGILLNNDEFSDIIKQNPWQIDIKTTLEKIQQRIYKNSEIKFRIGGRVLYSTSKLIHAKSDSIIKDSHHTQEILEENEVIEEDFHDFDENFEDDNFDKDFLKKVSLNAILGKKELEISKFKGNINSDSNISQYLHERDSELAKYISTNAFFKQDRNGNRYLASPMRKVYRKVDFSELGNALIKTLKYQIRSSSKNYKRKYININEDQIFPANILKEVEENHALIEEQIQQLFQTIQKRYRANEPISFIYLVLSPEPEGIVKTLLYLLQLVNRKKIEIWQKIPEDESKNHANFSSYDDSGINIFITPIL